MKDRPTPETDLLGYVPTDLAPAWPLVEHSRRLERQRDGLLEALKSIQRMCDEPAEEAGQEVPRFWVYVPAVRKKYEPAIASVKGGSDV